MVYNQNVINIDSTHSTCCNNLQGKSPASSKGPGQWCGIAIRDASCSRPGDCETMLPPIWIHKERAQWLLSHQHQRQIQFRTTPNLLPVWCSEIGIFDVIQCCKGESNPHGLTWHHHRIRHGCWRASSHVATCHETCLSLEALYLNFIVKVTSNILKGWPRIKSFSKC